MFFSNFECLSDSLEIALELKIKIKFMAYSSQWSHIGQLDRRDNVISIMLRQVY